MCVLMYETLSKKELVHDPDFGQRRKPRLDSKYPPLAEQTDEAQSFTCHRLRHRCDQVDSKVAQLVDAVKSRRWVVRCGCTSRSFHSRANECAKSRKLEWFCTRQGSLFLSSPCKKGTNGLRVRLCVVEQQEYVDDVDSDRAHSVSKPERRT